MPGRIFNLETVRNPRRLKPNFAGNATVAPKTWMTPLHQGLWPVISPRFNFLQWRYRTRQRLYKVNNIYRRNAEIQGRGVASRGEDFYQFLTILQDVLILQNKFQGEEFRLTDQPPSPVNHLPISLLCDIGVLERRLYTCKRYEGHHRAKLWLHVGHFREAAIWFW